MLSIIVSSGGETYYFATKQHNKESFKECLCSVGLGNTKLITFLMNIIMLMLVFHR